jgi:ParB family chromosome partitioning protein
MLETENTSLGEQIVPSGRLLYLNTNDLITGKSNPRHLFDEDRLKPLREDIREHGVLVPLMVYRPKGQTRYSILDGERRFRCCVELEKQGVERMKIPVNVVDPPDKIAGLLYMFAVHNLREEWELMPTALSLKIIMDKLNKTDPADLKALTSLSEPQIERCQVLLQYPEKFQRLSLDPDPKTRIPSNFWIELFPVLKVYEEQLPTLWKKLGGDGVIEKFVEKYRAKKIKSVIHFRRIMEAFQITEGKTRKDVIGALKDFIEDIDLETRETFDKFILDPRRVQSAITACSDFIKVIKRQQIDYSLERADLTKAFEEVREFAEQMLEKLRGSEDPEVARARE